MPDWFGNIPSTGPIEDPWNDDDEGLDYEEYRARPGVRSPPRNSGGRNFCGEGIGAWGVIGIVSLALIILALLGGSFIWALERWIPVSIGFILFSLLINSVVGRRFSSSSLPPVAQNSEVDPNQVKDETGPDNHPPPNTFAPRTPPPEYHPSAPPSHPPWDVPSSRSFGSDPSSLRTEGTQRPSVIERPRLGPIGPPHRSSRSPEDVLSRWDWGYQYPSTPLRLSCPPECSWDLLPHDPSHRSRESCQLGIEIIQIYFSIIHSLLHRCFRAKYSRHLFQSNGGQ